MLRLVLATALASAALSAQATIEHANFDTLVFDNLTSMGGPNLLLAIQTTIPTTFVATRIEMFSGEDVGPNTVAIWTHDAAGNKPGVPLASGAWQMGFTNTWQGAPLTTPLPLTAGDVVWIVWGPQDGAQASIEGSGAGAQPYRGSFDGGQTWNGPFQSLQWKFRVWSGPAGHYEIYGAGCQGTAGTPRLSWAGLPMIGASFDVLLARAPANTAALLLVGDSDTVASGLPLPLDLGILGAPGCSLLTSFPVTLATLASGAGEAMLPLALPPLPAAIGFELFNQWAVLDLPANAFGFTTSNGGAAIVGG